MRFQHILKFLSEQNLHECGLIETPELKTVIDLCMNYKACVLFSKNFYTFSEIPVTNQVRDIWSSFTVTPIPSRVNCIRLLRLCSVAFRASLRCSMSLHPWSSISTLIIRIKQASKINHLVPCMRPEFPILQLFCHCVLPGVSLYTPLRYVRKDLPPPTCSQSRTNPVVSTSRMPCASAQKPFWHTSVRLPTTSAALGLQHLSLAHRACVRHSTSGAVSLPSPWRLYICQYSPEQGQLPAQGHPLINAYFEADI